MPVTRRRRSVRPIVVAMLLGFALTACTAVMSRRQEANQRARAAYAYCEARRAAHQIATHLAAVDCAAPTVYGAYHEAAYPFDDLLYISIEARRIGAGRLDNGDVNEDVEKRDLATLDERIAAEEKRRFAIMEVGGSPTPVAPDVLVQGLVSVAPEPTPAELPVAPPGKAANCFTLGGEPRCN